MESESGYRFEVVNIHAAFVRYSDSSSYPYFFKTPLLQRAFIAVLNVRAVIPNRLQSSHSVMAVAPISVGMVTFPYSSIVIISLSLFIGVSFFVFFYGTANVLLHILQLMRQGFHVLTNLLGGDFGVYLRGFDIGMSQQTADGFNGYSVGQKYGRGVRMSRNVCA